MDAMDAIYKRRAVRELTEESVDDKQIRQLTCWIGFAQASLGTPEGKEALNLPSTQVPAAPIIVGQPKSMLPSVARKEPDTRFIG